MSAPKDRRTITLRYRHDAATGAVTLVVDVEVPDDEMPHEHRHELREVTEELLGVPLSSLPDGTVLRLRPQASHGHGEVLAEGEVRGGEIVPVRGVPSRA